MGTRGRNDLPVRMTYERFLEYLLLAPPWRILKVVHARSKEIDQGLAIRFGLVEAVVVPVASEGGI